MKAVIGSAILIVAAIGCRSSSAPRATGGDEPARADVAGHMAGQSGTPIGTLRAVGSGTGVDPHGAEAPDVALARAVGKPRGTVDGKDTAGFVAAQQARGRDPSILIFREHAFDPTGPAPRFRRPALARAAHPPAPGARGKWVVQFDHVPGAAERDAVAAAGTILRYVPNRAYLVELDGPGHAALALQRRTLGVRALVPFHPGLKFQADVTARLDGTNLDLGQMGLSITTFRGADAAVVAAAVAALNDPDVTILHTSDQGQLGVVQLVLAHVGPLAGLADLLAAMEEVEAIDELERLDVMNDSSIWMIQSGDRDAQTMPLFERDLLGTGQVVTVMDTGIDVDHCAMRYDATPGSITSSSAAQAPAVDVSAPTHKVVAYYLNGGSAYEGECTHGTHVAGSVAGDNFLNRSTATSPGHDEGDGMAPNAKLIMQDIGGPSMWGSCGLSIGNISNAFAQSYNSGSRIHTNSWGSISTSYSSISYAVDQAMWERNDYLVLFAAANSGPRVATINTHATHKNGIAVAAASHGLSGSEDLASFSSHGPTADGRIKPDLAAPGVSINSALATGTETDGNCGNVHYSGTSMATPTAAGGAALVRQYFAEGFYPSGGRRTADVRNPSAALIKAVMVNSGRNMTGAFTATDGANGAAAPIPTSGQGWGRLTLDDALFFEGDVRRLKVLNDVWNGATTVVAPATTAAITTGVTQTFSVTSVGCAEPLKFTLDWTDPPGAVGAGIQLVNNLDLEVVAPDGTVYKGNVFAGGWSAAGGAADALNSIENVYLRYPLPGTYTVRVIGRSVPGKGVTTPYDDTRQGYALVATGDFSGSTAPSFAYDSHTVGGGCDDDIYLDEGETAQLDLTIRNRGCSASSASTTVTLSVDPASEIPASQITFGPAAQTYGAIAGDGTALRSFDVTLASSASSWAGKAATLVATMHDPVAGVTKTKKLRITSSLDEVDAFVDRVEAGDELPWVNRPSDATYTMDQRPWQRVPGVYGAPSSQVWSDASGPGAYELEDVHSGWLSPMTPIAATDQMSTFEFWRYVDFGTATAGTSQAIVYYFDSPSGVINGDGMTGWTVAAQYSPGLADARQWVREQIVIGPQPPGSTHFRVVLMLRLLDGPAEGTFFDQLRVRKLVPDVKPPCGETCTTPPAFAGVAGASATCGMIEVSWAPGATSCGGALRYDVYRATDPAFTDAVRISPCGLEDTRLVDADVVIGTTYYYRVHAEDYATGTGACGGNEDANTVQIAATPSTGAPVFAGIATSAAANACSTATLGWSPAAPLCAGGVIRYNVYRSTVAGVLGERVSTCGAVAGTSFQDTGLTTGVTYHYTVQAVDSADPTCAAGNTSTNTAQTAVVPTDTTPPATTAAPAVAYTTCGGEVEVTWPAATDACTGIDDYVVYRSTTAGVLGTPVGTVTATRFVDQVDPSVPHYYTVHARDGAGNEATAVTQGATSMLPTFSGVSLVKPGATDCGSIEVYWPAAAPGCPTNGLHYNVYRSVDPAFVPGPTNRITTCATAPTDTSFVDTNVTGGTRYYYVVRAEDTSTTGDGPCGGYEDTNTNRQSGYPEDVLLSDGFEAGIDPLVWEASAGFTGAGGGHGGALAAWSGNAPGACEALTLANFLPLPAESVSLSFWSRFEIDPNRDRGIVEVSVDGNTWTKVTPIGGYPGVTVSGTSCIGGSYATAFTGSSAGQWRPYRVDLTPWAGASVKVRFRFGSDAGSTAPGGWYVDDVTISSAGLCFACENPPTFAGLTTVTAPSCGAVQLGWSPAAEGCPGKVVHYDVYRSTVQGQLGELVTGCANPVLGTSYTDTGLEPATTYYYTVRAEDGSTGLAGPCGGNIEANNNQLPGTPSDTTSPSFAGVTTAANQCTTGEIKLGWTPATDTCSGVKDYLVFRSSTPNAIGDQVATVTVPYAADAAGHGHEAELRGTTAVAGHDGTGVKLTGNAVGIVNPSGVPLGASWEIEAWFRWPLDNGNTTQYHTLTRGTGCGDHQIIVHTDQKSLGGYDNCTGGNWKDTGYDLDGLAPGWHHVRAVGSGTTTTYYVDGAPAGAPLAWKSTSNVYAIGNAATGGQAFGTIDDVKVTVGGVLRAHWDFTGVTDAPASYLDAPPGPGAYTYTVWARDRAGATAYSTVKQTATSSADLSFAGVQTASGAGLCNQTALTWAAADPVCGAGGGTAADGSPHGRTGTLTGTRPATGRDGGARTALELTGDDHVVVPTSTGLGPTTITLEAWVQPTSYGDYGTIIAKRPDNTANAQYILRNYGATGRVELYVYAGGGWRSCTTGTADVTPLGVWTHVAATYDGSAGRVYLNGVEKCTFAFTGAIQGGTGALYLGREQYNGYTYRGLIDEVRIYPGARTAAQIAGDATTTAVVDGETAAASYSFTNEGGLNYNVYRGESAAGPWTRVSTCGVSGTTFTDPALVRDTAYFYKVQVEDSLGEGGPCGGTEIANDVVLASTPTDTSDPSFAYYNGTATANCTTGDIDLAWPTASDCSTDQLTYRVFRSTEAGVAGEEIYRTPAPLSTVALDASPAGNHGTIVGASPAPGPAGPATALTTTAGYVSVPAAAGLSPAAAITLEAWVHPTSYASSGTFLRKTSDGGGLDQYYLRNYGTTGRVELGLYIGTGWKTCISPAGGANETPLNTWSHVAGTYDGATMRVYVGGVQVQACAQTGAIQTGDRKLYLGGHAYWGGSFAGRLDEVRVYPLARTAAEVVADAATTAVVDGALAAGAWSFTGEGLSPTRWSDATVVPGQHYYYAVFADDGEGQQYGGEFGALTLACTETGTCATAPTFAGVTAADNATAESCGGNAVALAWDPATPTCFGHPIHYDVFRSSEAGTLGTLVSSCATPPTGTTFVDTTAPAGTWYYTVRAADNLTGGGGACGGHADANLVQRPVTVTGDSHSDLAPATTSVAGLADASGGGCGLDPALAWDGPIEEHDPLGFRDCTPSTLARWTFDAGTAADDAGDVNDGVLGAAVTFATPGQDGTGQALAVNGTAGSFVRVASSDGVSPADDLAVEAWVNPTSYVNSGRFVDKGNMYRLYNYSTTGQVVFGVYVNGGWRECTTSSTDAASKTPLATWTHVRGTYDGQTVRVFVGGVEKCTLAYAGTIVRTTLPLYLGASNETGTTGHFNGRLDGIRLDETGRRQRLLAAIRRHGGTTGVYPFDGGAATDGSGAGNHGAAGSAVVPTAGPPGHGDALAFADATSSYVRIEDDPSLDPSAGLALEAWVKPDAFEYYGNFISKRFGGPSQYYLRNVGYGGTVAFAVWIDGAYRTCTTGEAIALATWTHVAATYDGQVGRVAFNGVEKCAFVYEGAVERGNAPIYIGSYDGTNGEAFDGAIDDVRIHVGALPHASGARHAIAAWFPFDAGGDDRVFGGADAALAGGAAVGPGYLGRGLVLDGVDDHATAADAAARNPGRASFTVSAWVKTGATTGTIAAKGLAGGTGAGWRVGLAGGAVTATLSDGTTAVSAQSAASIDDGDWHHVAAVFDRAAAGGGLTIYVDGAAEVAAPPSLAALGTADSTAAIELGAATGGASDFLAGSIDEVTITRYARPAAQVRGDADADSRLGGWRVYRSAAAGQLGAPVATLPRRRLTWRDEETLAAGTYHYTVRAFDRDGVEEENLVQRAVDVSASAPSFAGVASAFAGSCGDAQLVLGEATTCAAGLGTPAAGIREVVGNTMSYPASLNGRPGSPSLRTYTGQLAVPGPGTYTFQCDKYYWSDCLLWIDGVAVALPLNGPTVTATHVFAAGGSHDVRFQFSPDSGDGARTFDLKWSCTGGTCAPTVGLASIPAAAQSHRLETQDVLRYNVYRSTAPGVKGPLVAACQSPSGPTLVDRPPGNATYYYTVNAEDLSAPGAGPCGGTPEANDVQVAVAPTDTTSTSFAGASAITNACDASAAITITWPSWTDSCSATREYRIYRSVFAEADGELLGLAPPGATSYVDTTGTPGTTYYYRVFAVDVFGNFDASVAQVSATASDAQLAPAFAGVSSVSAGNYCNYAAVSWPAATPRCTGDAITYSVLRGDSATGPFTQVATGLTTTSWSHPATLVTGNRYHWRVRASADGTPDANVKTVSAVVTDTGVPTFAGLTSLASDCDDDGANLLGWGAATDTCSPVSFDVYRSTEQGHLGTVVATLPASTTSWNDTTAATGTTYAYAVLARDAWGNRSTSVVQRTIATANQEPSFAGVRTVVQGARCNEAMLSWVPATSACAGAALHYNVYRSPTPGTLGTMISQATNHVLKTRGAWSRASSNLRSGDSVSFDVMPTSTFPNLRVYLLTPDDLYGAGVVFDNNRIYPRTFTGSTSGTNHANLLAAVKPNVWYRVTLKADDVAGFTVEVGERDAGAPVAFNFEGLPPGRLDWGVNGFGDATKPEVYLDNYVESAAVGTFTEDFEVANAVDWSFGPDQVMPFLLQTTGASFVDTQAPVGTTWHYTVRAEDDSTGGAGPAGGVEDDNTYQIGHLSIDNQAPSFAGIDGAVSTCDAAGSINLSFPAATDSCTGVEGFHVYRSTIPGALGTLVGTSEGGGYQDVAGPGGTYYYTVRAFDGAGNEDGNVGQLAAGAGEVGPSFGGLDRVVATGCASNTLTWTPAQSGCDGRDVRYSVYRSTDPGFTPGPETLLTSCATAVPPMSSGGLHGEYFDDTGFAVQKAARLDPAIDFDWGTGTPVPGIAADTFAVRWTGELEVPAEGAYSLYLDANDGVRLEIDGYRVIDSWTNTTAERRGDIALTAGRHAVKLEYYDNTSSAKVKLLWQCATCTPALPKTIVPPARLYAPSRRWIDTSPIPGRPNYYVVRADDSAPIDGGDCTANEDGNLVRRGVDVLAGNVGPGPMASYDFDDGTADDGSGNLHQGTLYGPTFVPGDGQGGGALALVGTELDRVEAALTLPDSDHTVRFWFKTTGTPGMFEYMDGALGSATPGGGYDRAMYVTSSSPAGRVCQRVYNDELICSATGGWNDGLWHEAAMVLERGVGQRLYLDGALVASGAKAVSAFNTGTRIWFGYSHDPSGTANDYFTGRLDDLSLHDYVEFQGAAACPAPPAVPVVSLAEPCGATPNRVRLAWAAVPGATSYEVSRSSASCTSQGSFTPIATNVTGTTYDDTTVSGGDPAVVYVYKVRAFSAATGMYSDFSACQSCSPSGVCTRPPLFAGLDEAASSHSATCGNDLAWAPAQSQCATEGTGITYNVYRSTSASFTPSEFNRVASCVTGTSWHDGSTALVSGTTYHYLVRAEDSTTAPKPYGAGGACNNGNEDGNLARAAVATEGELRVASFTDSAGDGSTAALELPPTNWAIAWFDQHTPGGAQAYYSSSQPNQCDALVTPVIDVRSAPEGEPIPTVLSFWTNYLTSDGDGLVVEVATAPAYADWTPLGGAYTSTLDGDNGCGLAAGTPAFGSPPGAGTWSGWVERHFSLAGYEHRMIKLRFRLANSMNARAGGGVLVDDLTVTNANVPIGCAGAPPPPPCNGPPAFAGVGQVGAGADETSLAVAWSPAGATCVDSNLRYNVYRATTAPFTPSAGNRIAACLDATSLADGGLVQNTVYSYVVRAEDVAHPGAGPCGGLEDGNLVTLSASPTASRSVAVYDNFDGAGLSSAAWSWSGNWTQSSSGASGSSAYLPGVPEQCDVLAMNQWRTLAPGVNTYLTMRLRYESEAHFDGGYFELTTDGATWSRIEPEGGYPGTLVRSALACTVPGEDAEPGLSGSTAGGFRRLAFNLFAWSGRDVKVRLRWGSDATGVLPGAGVWLDDLAFEEEACTPSGADTDCDRRDDDCNGAIDDGYVGLACGTGACSAVSTCTDGVEVTCRPGAPAAADDRTCNGADDDCDGPVDEDCDACRCGPMSNGTCTTQAASGWVAVDVFDSSCGETVRRCWNYEPAAASHAAAAAACAAMTNAAGTASVLPSVTQLRSITNDARFFDGAGYGGQLLWTSTPSGTKWVKAEIASVNSWCDGTTCWPGSCVAGAQSTTNASVPYGCLVAYPAYCGDTRCEAGETAASCAIDCAPSCGDHMCNGAETCGSCPDDCAATASPASCCGDGTCTRPQETHLSCPKDCR